MSKGRILITGGSSGIGLATAMLAIKENYDVIIAGRSEQKLSLAQQQINHDHLCTMVVDITDETSILSLKENIGDIDHLVLAGSQVNVGGIRSLPLQQVQASFNSKFFAQYQMIQTLLSSINQKGSITLFSGSSGQKPEKDGELMSAINAAVEALSKGLALTLAPIRVNTVAPGLIDTPAYDSLDQASKQKMYQTFSNKLAIKRVGQAEEVAQSVLYLINSHYSTGTVLTIDGGHHVS